MPEREGKRERALRATAFSSWFPSASTRINHARLSHCCAFTITFRELTFILSSEREIPERFGCRPAASSPPHPHPPLPPYQSRAIVPSRLDIYMAIAGAPTHRLRCRCAPRPELKPPHYHRRTSCRGSKGRRVARLDEAAAGESVLRILEVMSRVVLYNTRFTRPSPPSSSFLPKPTSPSVRRHTVPRSLAPPRRVPRSILPHSRITAS
jgi:hypothetical protein